MVILFEEKRNEIEIYISAKINQEGKLVIEGFDKGALVKDIRGNWEYEYYLTVPKDQKEHFIKLLNTRTFDIPDDKALLDWIKIHFSGNEAFSSFQSFLNKEGIRSEMFSI